MNFIFLIFLYSIFFFFSYQKSNQNYLIFPFKKSTKVKNIFPDNLLQNDLEITLKIGTPSQNVNLNLRSNLYTFFITSSNVNLPFPTFNEKNSKSLIKESEKVEQYITKEYKEGFKIYETITLNEKELKNISLILATSISYNQSGALGLKLVDSHEFANDLSFIYQIKHKLNLNSYTFFIKYNNDEEGELIIGSYPHLLNNKYNEKDLFYQRAGKINNNVDWVIEFDMIKYDNNTIERINNKCLIQIEYALIHAPFNVKNYFIDNYFKNQCNQEFLIRKNIIMINCDKKFDISTFKNLSFISKDIDYEFVFTYKDLFIENGSKYIFSIIFDMKLNDKDNNWILGKTFMKKYQLIYDLDRKIIGLYKGNSSKGFNFYILFLIILILVIIGLIYYIFFYIKTPRKIRANELEDDNYLYLPN